MKSSVAHPRLFVPVFFAAMVFTMSSRSTLHAQDQTVNGNMGVSGEMDVYGNTFNFGSWATDPNKFGLGFTYAEDSNHASTLTLTTTRPVSGWLWQRAPNSGTGNLPQMRLSSGNALTLYDQASPTPNAAIILDPLGTNIFGTSTTFNGSDNEMPNQAIMGSNSVLTVSLADARYLVHTTGYSLSIGSGANVNNHIASIAIGYGSSTTADAALAVGFSATAAGAYSVAYGAGASSTGTDSTAVGTSSSAGPYSTALGWNANAAGTSGLAIGVAAQALSNNTIAIGNTTYASGYDSTALGFFATASGGGSAALGNYAHATSDQSTALGYQASSSGIAASALGAFSVANNGYATALSGYSTASGYNSVALGYASLASGDNSTTLGEGSGASGMNSSSLGFHSSAGGQYAVALGNYSNASGNFSTALTSSAVASGDYSTAGGNTTANGYYQFAVGRNGVSGGNAHTWVATDDLFTVGNGASATSPSNAFSVKKNGDAVLARNLTVNGAIIVQPQGDLSMGEFTATPSPTP